MFKIKSKQYAFALLLLLFLIGAGANEMHRKITGEENLVNLHGTTISITDQEGVFLLIDDNSITSTGLTYTIRNETGYPTYFGCDFYIAQRTGLIEKGWKEISWISDEPPTWWKHAIGLGLSFDGNYPLEGPVEWNDTIDWEEIYGVLLPGEYLFIKEIENSYYIASKFNIV